MDIIQLLSAAGFGGIVGSLLTTVAQAWLSHKSSIASRNFQEKKEAYVGLLDAIYKSHVEPSAKTATYAGLWKARCELVAPQEVVKVLHEYENTNSNNGKIHPDRPRIMQELMDAMRKDLGVTVV